MPIQQDNLTLIMLTLVGFIAWVIIRYSKNYLAGDPGQTRYNLWLSLTLISVCILVVTDHLLLLALAWTATNLSLHQLLTFYPERRAAMLAAHKKFLLSRLADLTLFEAVFLIWQALGTDRIDLISQSLATQGTLTPRLEWAAVLLAVTAILKCAQLPFHGWLIQVMEAPTPVSALLHAGVVNIGGFVMIRLAVLMAPAEPAQILLAGFGGLTALLAGLVMMTRISVKVGLAWSTCAQMGFMLMECGLGAYSLALLHLVGHSLYKAHAFLASGNTVYNYRIRTLYPTDRLRPALRWRVATAGVILTVLYLVLHQAFSRLVGLPAAPLHTPALILALFALGMLVVSFCVIRLAPQGRFSRWLYPRAFAGFHLDEGFTRLTLRIWPARLPNPTHEVLP